MESNHNYKYGGKSVFAQVSYFLINYNYKLIKYTVQMIDVVILISVCIIFIYKIKN